MIKPAQLKHILELWEALSEKKKSWSKVIVASILLIMSVPFSPSQCETPKQDNHNIERIVNDAGNQTLESK